jgi:F1F0 ATPase subunit 2
MSGQAPLLVLAALAGAAFGAVYLGLLWVAVRRLPQGRGGAGVFVLLGLLRVALLLGVLAAAAASGVPAAALLAGLGGFVALRLVATRLLGRPAEGEAGWK